MSLRGAIATKQSKEKRNKFFIDEIASPAAGGLAMTCKENKFVRICNL
jgi:hypothetical protein